jgi:hypothetical protein
MPQFSNWDIGFDLMPKGAAIHKAKSLMPDLVKRACDEGWHQQLIGFIQQRHCRPNGDQIKALVRDHEEIDFRLSQMDQYMRAAWKYDDILERRAALKAELTQPIELQAAE